MIYLLIIAVLLIGSFLPLQKSKKDLTVALGLGCLGVLVTAGFINHTNPNHSIIAIPVMVYLLLQPLFSSAQEEKLLSAPISFVAYLGLSELAYLESSYVLLASLVVFVLVSPSDKKKRLTMQVLPILGFLSLRLSYIDLIGPVDPLLSDSAFSNLFLPSFNRNLMNLVYLVCVLSTGINFLNNRKCSFSSTLFILINFYFLNFEISVGVMYAAFLALSLFIFLKQLSSRESGVLALLILMVFQFHNELSYLVLIFIIGLRLGALLPLPVKDFLHRLDWRLIGLTLVLLSCLYFNAPFSRMASLLIVLLACHLYHHETKEVVV